MYKEELISIIVITYNSESTVIETLESIKNQNYKTLELIVSDDKSTDNTISIVKDWLSQNSNRFHRIELVSSNKNKGVSANCNQGIFTSTGSWFKLIAGDDILLPNCISDNIEYLKDKSDIRFLLSKLKQFQTGQTEKDYLDHNWSFDIYEFSKKSVNEQLNHFLTGNSIWSISLFCNREVFDQIGGYDEKNTFIEDYPFFLKMTHNKYKIFILDKFTVAYRIQEKSLSSRGMIVKRYDFQFWKATLVYAVKNYRIKFVFNALWNLLLLRLTKMFINNKRITDKLYLIRKKMALNKI